MTFNKAKNKSTIWHNEGHQLSDWAKSDYNLTVTHNNYAITDNGNPTTIEGLEEEYNRVGWQSCNECSYDPNGDWYLMTMMKMNLMIVRGT